jgi:hypothetical protein
MRVAAIYDFHGNLPALEAVLQEVHKGNVDLVVVGGDVVPGPMPRDTLACLLELKIPTQFMKALPWTCGSASASSCGTFPGGPRRSPWK